MGNNGSRSCFGKVFSSKRRNKVAPLPPQLEDYDSEREFVPSTDGIRIASSQEIRTEDSNEIGVVEDTVTSSVMATETIVVCPVGNPDDEMVVVDLEEECEDTVEMKQGTQLERTQVMNEKNLEQMEEREHTEDKKEQMEERAHTEDKEMEEREHTEDKEELMEEREHTEDREEQMEEREHTKDNEEQMEEREHTEDKEEQMEEREHTEDTEEQMEKREHTEDNEEQMEEREHTKDKEEQMEEREHADDKEELMEEREHTEDSEEQMEEREHTEDREEQMEEREHTEDSEEQMEEREHTEDSEEQMEEREHAEDTEEQMEEREHAEDKEEEGHGYQVGNSADSLQGDVEYLSYDRSESVVSCRLLRSVESVDNLSISSTSPIMFNVDYESDYESYSSSDDTDSGDERRRSPPPPPISDDEDDVTPREEGEWRLGLPTFGEARSADDLVDEINYVLEIENTATNQSWHRYAIRTSWMKRMGWDISMVPEVDDE